VLTPTVAVLRGTGDGHFEPYVLPDSAGMWLKPYYEGVGFTPLPADVSPPFTLETVAAVERSQIVTQLLPVSLDSHAAMDLLILSPHPSCDCDANASLWAGNYSGGVGYFDGPIGDWHPLGWDPAYATMADMGPAADGLDDLIVTHSADQNIAVLHRTPNQPTFDEPTYYATPAEPRGIAGADMDGDGLPDLVIVVKDNVVIAWGKADDEPGPGGFHQMAFVRPVGGPDGSYPGSDPQVVLTDDFNYDGSLDLIVSNRSSDTLSLFFGSGDRLFPGQIEAPTGRGPQKLIRARFNGDSCTDYAVLNPSGMTVTLFLSNPADCPVGGGQ